MINSTNTINIDGTVLNHDEVKGLFSLNSDDTFTKWVVRPLAILSVLGLGAATLFVSAFIALIGLAMIPLVALFAWAMKAKVERELAEKDPVVSTQRADTDDASQPAQ